jgi:hypothetical protein
VAKAPASPNKVGAIIRRVQHLARPNVVTGQIFVAICRLSPDLQQICFCISRGKRLSRHAVEGDFMRQTGLKATLFLRMLCALSLALLGLAHQAPKAVASEGYDAAAYVLPDGTFASLCITVKEADGKTFAFKSNCEACRLSASVILPTPDAGSWLERKFASLINAPIETSAVAGASAVSRPNSRAPPVLA